MLTLLATACWPAAAAPPSRIRLLTGDVPLPIALAAAPGEDRLLFIAGRAGIIRVFDREAGLVLPTPLLDISDRVNGDVDNGLLGLAFDPDYQQNGFFFVNYNTHGGDIVLERYRVNPGELAADAQSASIVWRYPRPLGHNGGWIGFSPVNGLLVITSGDGGSGGTADFANRAQTIINQPLGKILRIDPRGDDFPEDPLRNYRIPPDNPYVGLPGDDEIWSYGVRNPWRASFDRLTGDFYFGDVGMDSVEEVNHEPASSAGGRNYGWPCMEGSRCTGSTFCACNGAGLSGPFFEYDHSVGLSVIGGYVYRGQAIPALRGLYFFTDFLSGRYWAATAPPHPGGAQVEDRSAHFIPLGATTPLKFVASWGEDNQGELYLCSLLQSRVYQVVPFRCEPEIDAHPVPQTRAAGSTISLRVLGAGEAPLTYQWLKDGSPLESTPDGRISGAASATLTITRARPSDAGEYAVVLSSPCGELVSEPAYVSVFTCQSADFNGDGVLGIQDLFDFLAAYFAGDPRGDFNQNGSASLQDVLDYLASYFAGCLE